MGEPIAKGSPLLVREPELLILPGEIARELALDAQRCAPREACGLLLDSAVPRAERVPCVHIERGERMTNISPREDRFLFDPLEFVRRERDARSTGLSIAGIYHSHPAGPAVPSSEDGRAARALWGTGRSWIYLILGRAPGGWPSRRAWLLIDGQWREAECLEDGPPVSAEPGPVRFG